MYTYKVCHGDTFNKLVFAVGTDSFVVDPVVFVCLMLLGVVFDCCIYLSFNLPVFIDYLHFSKVLQRLSSSEDLTHI